MVTEKCVSFCCKDIRQFNINDEGLEELAQEQINFGAAYGRVPVNCFSGERQPQASPIFVCFTSNISFIFQKYVFSHFFLLLPNYPSSECILIEFVILKCF